MARLDRYILDVASLEVQVKLKILVNGQMEYPPHLLNLRYLSLRRLQLPTGA